MTYVGSTSRRGDDHRTLAELSFQVLLFFQWYGSRLSFYVFPWTLAACSIVVAMYIWYFMVTLLDVSTETSFRLEVFGFEKLLHSISEIQILNMQSLIQKLWVLESGSLYLNLLARETLKYWCQGLICDF